MFVEKNLIKHYLSVRKNTVWNFILKLNFMFGITLKCFYFLQDQMPDTHFLFRSDSLVLELTTENSFDQNIADKLNYVIKK